MLSSNAITAVARRALSVATPANSAIRTHKLPGNRNTLAKYGGQHTVTAMPGDGIGPEMIGHIKKIFKYCNAPINFEEVQMTSIYQDGDMEEVIYAIERNGVAIKGNIETKFDDPAFVSRNVELRRRLDLWANVLHCVTIPTVPTRHKDIDIVLIRENTEGEYSGLEHESIPGVVESIKIVTQEKIERIARFAYEYAVLNGRKKVTAVHKANIQKLGDGLFLQIAKDMAKEYPTVEFDQMIVDNASMQLVSRPQQFDVMLMPNLYGNIISNIACGLVGGPGLVSGMNFGDVHAVFETGTRNTGTGLVGKDIANPTAFIRAGVDMLRYVGCHKHADLISDALWEALTEQGVHTGDIGGSAKTSELVERTLRNIERMMPRLD
ncbi:hypothetical protein PMAYCL1PPCAC_26196 [Pristionchus mayeri]|uniref:Isocitrate dehydrogenase [NAD] subunit, mitochondrial n=1 Tax=Pristionchus mayeri TaxID=1317129 RepID=A0AAN5D395_9BILA|nr:hypothetical protein PMAYCL1PPCAC_26196 [Pristionchus mayeri]